MGIYNSLTDTWMWKLGLRPRYSFSGNICFKFSAFCLCSMVFCSMFVCTLYFPAQIISLRKQIIGRHSLHIKIYFLFGNYIQYLLTYTCIYYICDNQSAATFCVLYLHCCTMYIQFSTTIFLFYDIEDLHIFIRNCTVCIARRRTMSCSHQSYTYIFVYVIISSAFPPIACIVLPKKLINNKNTINTSKLSPITALNELAVLDCNMSPPPLCKEESMAKM